MRPTRMLKVFFFLAVKPVTSMLLGERASPTLVSIEIAGDVGKSHACGMSHACGVS